MSCTACIFDSDGSCEGADSTRRGIRQNNEDGGRQHHEVTNYAAALLAHPEIPQHPESSNWNGQSATISTLGPQQPQPPRMYETWNDGPFHFCADLEIFAHISLCTNISTIQKKV